MFWCGGFDGVTVGGESFGVRWYDKYDEDDDEVLDGDEVGR